jgi:hypothetical protein
MFTNGAPRGVLDDRRVAILPRSDTRSKRPAAGAAAISAQSADWTPDEMFDESTTTHDAPAVVARGRLGVRYGDEFRTWVTAGA